MAKFLERFVVGLVEEWRFLVTLPGTFFTAYFFLGFAIVHAPVLLDLHPEWGMIVVFAGIIAGAIGFLFAFLFVIIGMFLGALLLSKV